MITQEAVDAFNNRLVLTPNSIKKLSPSQQDAVKAKGSNAEALLKNKDFAMFIHEYKFDMCDQLAAVVGHSSDDNARRVALGNQIAGIDQFIALLQKAVYYKNQVVSLQSPTTNES